MSTVVPPPPDAPKGPEEPKRSVSTSASVPLTGEQALVGAAVLGAVGHILTPSVPDRISQKERGEDSGEAARDADLVQAKVELFQQIYGEGDVDTVYFYDETGLVVKEKNLPKTWSEMTQEARKTWLNENKPKSEKAISTDGIRISFPKFDSKSEKGLVETAVDRSLEQAQDSRYFGNEKLSIEDAMWKICEAYEVPVEIAMGFAANRSLFDKADVDRNEAGDMGGRGLFKLTTGAYTEALTYMQRHSEYSQKVRKGRLGDFEKEWQNRFVQIEVFCAYYRRLYDGLTGERGALKTLKDRLNTIDPSYSSDSVEEQAVITAYLSGPTRVKEVIQAFAKLPDEKIKEVLGEAPYGSDVWPEILRDSFGRNGINQESLDFTGKVYAMSAMVSEEGAAYVGEATGTGGRSWLKALSLLTGAAAMGAGGTLTAQTALKQQRAEALTRRDLLIRALGAAALVTPPGKLIAASIELPDWDFGGEEPVPPPPPPEGPQEKPSFPEVAEQAKKTLDTLYADLKSQKRILRTPNEQSEAKRYSQPSQDTLVRGSFNKVIGKELTDEIYKTRKDKQSGRNHLYDKAAPKVEAYRDARLKDGTFVQLQNDNANCFCEGVGTTSGTGNNPDWMCMHKDLVPLIETMIELVNYQIDLFNANPSAYGKAKNRKLSHVSALRLSGALRGPKQTKKMLNDPTLASQTTKSLTAHWGGGTVDIGSYVNGNAHIARISEDMLDENGTVDLKAGEKLSNGKFKAEAALISVFMGRALFAMKAPLEAIEHIKMMPLWERKPKNWHVSTDL